LYIAKFLIISIERTVQNRTIAFLFVQQKSAFSRGKRIASCLKIRRTILNNIKRKSVSLQKKQRVISSQIETIEALQQGDAVVFEKTFKNYYEILCHYANSFIGDMDEAEEIVQTTFITLWEKKNQIEIHTSMKSYLYQAVHNQCLNKIKHDRVKQTHFEYVTYQNDIESSDGYENIVGKELSERINESINSLPPQCRTVFMLSRFENYSYADIAKQLNLSVKTIENHMGKALRLMRMQLADYLPLIVWFLFTTNY